MAYTEIKQKNRKKYYYRVRSIREGKTFKKERIYLGRDMPKGLLLLKEQEADKKLNIQKKKGKLDSLNKLLPKIKRILIRNKVKRAGIFGSYVRGEQKKNSDIDILIHPTKGMGLRFFGLQLELEETLGRKVDLVSYNGLSPYLKKYILAEEVKIL